MGPDALFVEDLWCRLGGRDILRGISFSVYKGEFVTVVGPNGAGKTTLLRSLVRLVARARGRIEVFGENLDALSSRQLARKMSYVAQGDGGGAPFTVEQFVFMGRYAHLGPFGGYTERDRAAVERALAVTGTEGLRRRVLGSLSGGERQKVLLAACVAQECPCVLLDEPVTFLDWRHKAEILSLLRRLNEEQGATIVAVSHDLTSVVPVSRRSIALREGRVLFDGPSSALLVPDRLREVYATEFCVVAHPQSGRPVALACEV